MYLNLVAAKESDDYKTQLMTATKRGASRELFEETGINVRNNLDRLSPAGLRTSPTRNKDGVELLVNEYKHQLFYFLMVTDDDFSKDGVKAHGPEMDLPLLRRLILLRTTL
jgi:hypothetical protein